MGQYDEIYRRAFADALAENLQGDRIEELSPEECEQAVAAAREFAEGEVEAAKALAAEGRLDSTERCPLGVRCESCGTEASAEVRLVVRLLPTPLGRLCLTLCPTCARSDVPPPITVGTAARLVDQHRAHLEENR